MAFSVQKSCRCAFDRSIDVIPADQIFGLSQEALTHLNIRVPMPQIKKLMDAIDRDKSGAVCNICLLT